MSFTLVLNSNNSIGTLNNYNTYQYNFIGGNFKIDGDDWDLSVSSIQIPYSFFNITAALGNNTFSFYWTVNTTRTLYTITIPDGFYTTTTYNQYLQLYFVNNGFYLINNGLFVYYIVLSYNITFYANSLQTYLVPISLPSGYTQPSNFKGYPSVSQTPQVVFNQNNNFIGFSIGSYPSIFPYTSNYNINSNILVIGSSVNSIIIRCSLINNNVTIPSDILDSFNINADFGSNIIYEPTFEKRIKVNKGIYGSFIITFVDQNYNLINMRDNNITVTLLLRKNNKLLN